MAATRDPEEMKHIWVSWRNATGKHFRGLFQQYVTILNEVAVKNSTYTFF